MLRDLDIRLVLRALSTIFASSGYYSRGILDSKRSDRSEHKYL